VESLLKPRDECGDPIRPEDVLSDEEAAEVRRKWRSRLGKVRVVGVGIPKDPFLRKGRDEGR
jgi:hypothetical protein